jgi:hypothetical protein
MALQAEKFLILCLIILEIVEKHIPFMSPNWLCPNVLRVKLKPRSLDPMGIDRHLAYLTSPTSLFCSH